MNQSSLFSSTNAFADANPAVGISLDANHAARSGSGGASGDEEGEPWCSGFPAGRSRADEKPKNLGGGASGLNVRFDAD